MNHGLKVGDILAARYEVISIIGHGGMGKVFLAEDLRMNRKRWAIKEISHFYYENVIHDEAVMLLQLEHPRLPTIVDHIPRNNYGFSYIVMEFVEGYTLQQIFEQNKGKIDQESLIKWSIQICDFLHDIHIHKNPIIYRDLKPSNVMIDPKSNVRIIDFGIARQYKAGATNDTVPIGTIGFAAPEQLNGKQSDQRTDLYNLGAMLYYLLSGGQYFYVSQRPLSLIKGKKVTQPLSHIVDQLLQANPENRIQTSLHVKEQLQTCLSDRQSPISINSTLNTEMSNKRMKTIGITSIFAHSGTTFITMTISSILKEIQIQHAVVEAPCNEPIHYDLLGGQWNIPDSYLFLMDRVDSNNNIRGHLWNSGSAQLYPLPSTWQPILEHDIFNNSIKRYIDRPLVIVDFSHKWLTRMISTSVQQVDELIVVIDCWPWKISQERFWNKLKEIAELRKRGIKIHLLINRFIQHPENRDWIRSLPIKPRILVPNVPYQHMIEMNGAQAWKEMSQGIKKQLLQLVTS